MIIFVLEHMRVLTDSDKAQRSEKGEGEQLGGTGKDFPKEIRWDWGIKDWGESKKVGVCVLDISTGKVAAPVPQ